MMVFLGAARGCGWQKICAFINLGAYYGVAIPCAILFAFGCHLGGKVCHSLCIFSHFTALQPTT